VAKSKDLQSGEIERLLQDLGSELEARGFSTVRVLLVGGAYMLLTIGNRLTTQDVDVFPLNFASTAQPDQETKKILTAIRSVALRNGLKREWFSDAAFGIVGELQPPPELLQLWRSYGALEIYLPPAEFIFSLKVFGYRDRDLNDILALIGKLQIETHEQAQAIVDRYISREIQREYRLSMALDELFEE
jgi:hypothetical protein